MLIELKQVCKTYGRGDARIWALRDVDLTVERGEYVSIMGPSGSGKSTLFNMVGGLDLCSSGTVTIGGIDLGSLRDGELAFFRGRHIGYIFQSYNLVPSLTALKNVALPAVLGGADPAAAARRAVAVLERVGLGHRLDHRPDELSGGQQQRVAIARALANDPTILLADEPTANLDLHTGEEIIALMYQLCREFKATVVTATHDHKMLKTSDRVVWMADGQISRIQSADQLEIETGSIEG